MPEDCYGPTRELYWPSSFSWRGFLIGLGSALFIVGVWAIWDLLPGAVALIFFALTFVTILAAKLAPPSAAVEKGDGGDRAYLLAEVVVSWLVGFVVMALIIAWLFMALMMGL